MKDYYQRLFKYDRWANQRIVDAMRLLPSPEGRGLHLLSHIFAAQEIWLGRITGNLSSLPPFPERSLPECADAFEMTSKNWNEYLLSVSDAELNRQVSYVNTKGEKFVTSVKDILTHVINHSTYHRAQIVITLKGKIEKLPVTDFIVFVRG